MDIFQIKEDLEADKINYSEAYNRIKNLPKPWKAKGWLDKREDLLKEHCEQCGSKDCVLVIQHLGHPQTFADIRRSLLAKAIMESDWARSERAGVLTTTEQEVQSFKAQNSCRRLACPKCERLSFKERKTMAPRYKCINCNHTFDNPVEVNYCEKFKKQIEHVDIRSVLLSEKYVQREFLIKETIYEQQKELLGKQALLTSIEEHLQYISLEGTVTFCKTCASRMDFSGQLLCYNCKKNYFNYSLYDSCYKCHEKGLHTKNPFASRIFDLESRNHND